MAAIRGSVHFQFKSRFVVVCFLAVMASTHISKLAASSLSPRGTKVEQQF